MMSFGALIQGHAHPKIVEVVTQTMAEGSHFAAATSAEAEAAERFCRMVPTRGGGPFHKQRNRGDDARLAPGPCSHWSDEVSQIRRALSRMV